MTGKFFILSLKNIRHRSLRSWLTILGIIIGVALIVSILSLGKGLERTVLQQMKMFGSDLIYIFPGEETNPLIGIMGGGSFRQKELDEIEDVPGTKMVIPFDVEFATVEFKGEEKSTLIHASPIKETKEIYTDARGFGLESGDWPDREESSEILIGSKIANGLFRENIYVGDEVKIKSKKFRVVGILSEMGSSEDDNAIYMSMKNIEKITGTKASYSFVMAMLEEGADANKVAEEIKYRLRQERGSADFTVLTSEKTEKIVGDVIGTIQIGVLFIAIFSIIVGGIGVMNTMYTSVLERRREIGIMKAIGATNSNILTIFIIESGIIGAIGGVIGLALGLGLAKMAEIGAVRGGFKFLKIYASWELVLGVLFFSFIIGVISGALPARQASKLNPAEALRYE